ncbi:MAG: protein kinase family protein, partial [Actinomycetia bacterium]|nr:protein kinase family protein [Actinomycetes bacterium]
MTRTRFSARIGGAVTKLPVQVVAPRRQGAVRAHREAVVAGVGGDLGHPGHLSVHADFCRHSGRNHYRCVMADGAGDLISGRYRLIEPIGRGGMGTVWRGHDETLDREVAVKEILLPRELSDDERDSLNKRAMREARSAARLNHRGIITVHDVALHHDCPVILKLELAGPPPKVGELLLLRTGQLRSTVVIGVGLVHPIPQAG